MKMMAASSDPFYLIREGRFGEAVAAYSAMLRDHLHSPLLTNRGIGYLNMGELDKALADFRRAEAVNEQEINDRSDGYLQYVGLLLWIKGQEKDAAEQWYELIQGLDTGRIMFSDMAGGVENGCLLWFTACFNSDLGEYMESANEFLRKKTKSSKISYWPGPIAQYLLDRLSEKELKDAARNKVITLRDRQFCQAHFYVAAKAFHNGDMEGCRKALTESARAGQHSLIEKEYYLAKHELARMVR